MYSYQSVSAKHFISTAMFVNASDIEAFCKALENAAGGEESTTVLSGEEFSITSPLRDSIQIRKQRNDGRFSNVFIDTSEMDVIVKVLKKFAAGNREPGTNIPDKGNPIDA